MEQEQVSFFNLEMIFFCLLLETLDTNAGIRTQEAVALELKSSPFDRSGTVVFYINLIFLNLYAEGGIRTHEAVAVELKSTPFDRSGTSAFYLPPLYIYILFSKYVISYIYINQY